MGSVQVTKCKDCLIWQYRREELVREYYELIPNVARFCKQDELLRTAQTAYKIEAQLKSKIIAHILKMDSHCPKGICLLVAKEAEFWKQFK